MNAKPTRVLILFFMTIAVVVIFAGFRLRGETIHLGGQSGGASDQLPNALMQKLADALSGKWTIEETSAPISDQTKSVTSHGTEVWSTKPGGIPFTEEYHSVGLDGDQYDHAFFWWDASDNKLKGMFCAAFNTEGCSPFVVSWKDDQFVMTGEYKSDYKVIGWTENFKMSGADTFTQTLYQGVKDHPQQLMSTIHATRAK